MRKLMSVLLLSFVATLCLAQERPLATRLSRDTILIGD